MHIKELIAGYYTDKEGYVNSEVAGFGKPKNPCDYEEVVCLETKDGQVWTFLHSQVSFDKKEELHVFECGFEEETYQTPRIITSVFVFDNCYCIKGCILKEHDGKYYIRTDKFVFQTDATTITLPYDDWGKTKPVERRKQDIKSVAQLTPRTKRSYYKILPYWNMGMSIRKIMREAHVSYEVIRKVQGCLPERDVS